MSKAKQKQHRSKSQRNRRDVKAKRNTHAVGPSPQVGQANTPSEIGRTRFVVAGLLALLFVWAYLPTLIELAGEWERIPDYSHGYLVIPLACLFLWLRRESFPGISRGVNLAGVLLIFAASALRFVSAYYYLDACDGWSIPIWLGGYVLLLFGWASFLWALPAIAFLFFMVPLPYTLEIMLAGPLQSISTQISVFVLQCLNLTAVASGNVISVGSFPETHNLEVQRACSGLRIFFGISALAYAFIILFKRPVWVRLLIVASILPIALVANSLRIVATAMLFEFGFAESAKKLAHDVAGWVMIPLAAALFGLFLLYLDKLFPVVQTVDPAEVIRTRARSRQRS